MTYLRKLLVAALVFAGISPAIAQVPNFTLPPSTVIGRSAASAGPAQAIPFSLLFAAMGVQTSLTVNTVVFPGATSGSATVSAQSVAGTPALKWPTASGTVPSTATAPITLNATTGAIGCATCPGVAGFVESIAAGTGPLTLGPELQLSGSQIKGRLNSAILNASPSDPTNTSNTTGVFMGLGVTTCRFTPTYSTRARFTIQGKIFSNTSGSGAAFHLRFASGAGPSNGTAVGATGTALTSTVNSAGTGPAVFPFTADGIATGLTPATTYWFDIVLSASANTAAIASLTCVAQEVM